MVTTNSQDLQATSTQEEKHAEPFLLNIGTLIGELNEFRASNGASLLTKQVSDWRSPASYQSWWEAAVLERFVSYLGGGAHVLHSANNHMVIRSGAAETHRQDAFGLCVPCAFGCYRRYPIYRSRSELLELQNERTPTSRFRAAFGYSHTEEGDVDSERGLRTFYSIQSAQRLVQSPSRHCHGKEEETDFARDSRKEPRRSIGDARRNRTSNRAVITTNRPRVMSCGRFLFEI